MEKREYIPEETYNQRISWYTLTRKFEQSDSRYRSHDHSRNSSSPDERTHSRSRWRHDHGKRNYSRSRSRHDNLRNLSSPEQRNFSRSRSRSPRATYREERREPHNDEIYQSSRLRSPSEGIESYTGNQSQPKRKRKSLNRVWASRVLKARYVFGKIAINELNGIVDVRDETARIKYQAVLDEYAKYKESLAREEQQIEKTALKSKRSNSPIKTIAKQSFSKSPCRKPIIIPVSYTQVLYLGLRTIIKLS